MNPIASKFAKVVGAGFLVFTAAAATGCYAGVEEPGYYPSAGFVATASPVYWEGRPTYWYGNHWYYRDGGGRWSYYRSEPHGLYERRAAAPGHYGAPARRYERRR